MTNYQLYKGAESAIKVFEQYKMCVHMTWAFAKWLDIEGADKDDELTYLLKLDKAGILAAPGYKRIKSLKSKGGAK